MASPLISNGGYSSTLQNTTDILKSSRRRFLLALEELNTVEFEDKTPMEQLASAHSRSSS